MLRAGPRFLAAMSLSGHSPVLPWPLGIRAGDTAHHADSEVVPPTVGASTPDSPGNSNVALGAQAGPVVVEAQTEPVRLPSPPPKAQAKKAPPPLRWPGGCAAISAVSGTRAATADAAGACSGRGGAETFRGALTVAPGARGDPSGAGAVAIAGR